MALQPEQVAQLLYAAGFKGEALVEMLAIGKRESSYTPEAHRTDGDPNGNTGDFGLFQINYSNVPALQKAGIIGSARDLLDPQKNAAAAYYLSHQGTSFGAWSAVAGKGWTAGGNPLAGTNITVARQVVANAQTQGLLGKDWDAGSYQLIPGAGVGTATLTTPGAGGTGTPPASSVSTVIKFPSDAQFFTAPSGMISAVFDVGGAEVYYNISDTEWDPAGKNVQQISNQDWDHKVQGMVNGGDAAELVNTGAQFGTYRAYFDNVLSQVMGPNNPSANDPEIRKILVDRASRPDMTDAEFQNKLQGTQWYQTHTQGQRAWNDLGSADQAQKTSDTAAQLAQTWYQYTGENIATDDPRIANYALKVASGEMGLGDWTENVAKKTAAGMAASPWSQQLKQPGIDVENTALKIRQQLTTWGLQWSEGTVQQWAHDIVNKDKSDDDLTNAVKDQAQVLYPWKDRDTDTTSAASPWTETYKRVMETDAPLTNPNIQKALTAGQQPWAFEQDLKKSSGWLNTKNAKADMTSMIGSAGKLMGFTS